MAPQQPEMVAMSTTMQHPTKNTDELQYSLQHKNHQEQNDAPKTNTITVNKTHLVDSDKIKSTTSNLNTNFMDRVLEAMLNKTAVTNLPPTKPKTTPTTSSDFTTEYYNKYKSNNSSNSSISSTKSTTTLTNSTPSPRPPVPPQSRVRKQNNLVTRERAYSPSRKNGSVKLNSTSSKPSKFSTYFDSDDGLLISPSLVNGHTSIVDGKTADYLPSSFLADQSDPSAIKASLNLPLNKSDMPSTITNGIGTYYSDRYRLRNATTARSPSPALSILSNSSSRCSSSLSNATSASRTSSTYAALQTPPRRVFPQTYTRGNPLDAYEMRHLESSPVVIDANLSFVLGCEKQPVRQTFRPSPSHQEPQTSSAYLSEKIQNFLRRTDHVQEEWSAQSRRPRTTNSASRSAVGNDSRCTTPTNSVYDDYDTISLIERQRERASMERCPSVGRTRSSQNILTKAYQLSKTLPRTPTSRSNSVARDYTEDDDDRTIHEEDYNVFDEVG